MLKLYVLNLILLKCLWKVTNAKWPSSHVVNEDMLALLREDKSLYVYKLSIDGAELIVKEPLETADGGHNASSPIFSGNFIYGVDKVNTFCYDVSKRSFLWRGEKTGDAEPSHILADDKVIFGGKGKTGLLMVDASNKLFLFWFRERKVIS